MKKVVTDSGQYEYVESSTERKFRRILKLVFAVIVSGYFIYYIQTAGVTLHCKMLNRSDDCIKQAMRVKPNLNVIHISMVVCGDRFTEAMVLLKSTTLLTRAPIYAHVFVDDNVRPKMKKQFDSWPNAVKNKFQYSLYKIQYPEDQNFDHWKNLFRVCSSQRLFMPAIMKDLDSVLYVDSDTLVLGPLDDLWNMLLKFNSTQIAGLTGETEKAVGSWYNSIAKQPYVPPYGVNSGVMLMNLTRMRKVGWLSSIMYFYKIHQQTIILGDQDIINVYFHAYPERLYRFTCNWNYRPDHCMYDENNCKSAEKNGIAIIHGSRSNFHNDKQPMFRAVFQAYDKHNFNESLEKDLLPRVEKYILDSPYSQCKNVSEIFSAQLKRLVKTH